MTLITYSKLASAVALAFALGACNPMTVQETTGSAQHQKAGTISPATAQTTAMDQFISELISKMTIEEKVGQMNQYNGFWDVTGPVPKEGHAAKKYADLIMRRTSENNQEIMKIVITHPSAGPYIESEGPGLAFSLPLGQLTLIKQ